MQKIFISPIGWGILSGLMVATSFIPWPPWAVLWAWVPVFWVIEETPEIKVGWWAGWICQFIIALVGFYWIAYTVVTFGRLPWIVGFVVLFLFGAFMHWYIPVSIIINIWAKNKFRLKGFWAHMCYAFVFILLERFWPVIFPWQLSYSLTYGHWPINQLAEFVGFKGLNALLWIFNALIAYGLRMPHVKRIMVIILIGLTWGALNLIGWQWAKFRQKVANSSILKPLIVQPNVGNHERYWHLYGYGFQNQALWDLINLTSKALQNSNQKPDFILWPESAVPDFINDLTLQNTQMLHAQIANWDIPLITGALSRTWISPQKHHDYNAVFLFANPKRPTDFLEYRKTHLLIFGEYTPGGDLFPALNKISPAGSGFKSGSGPQVFPFDKWQIGVQICYESLFESFNRKLSLLGATLIINVTNDSWFGPWSEPWQHLYMTVARAIELRRPIIRVTNTGISAGIDPFGKILWHTPVNSRISQIFATEFKQINDITLFTKYPYITEFISLIGLILSLALSANIGENHEVVRKPS